MSRIERERKTWALTRYNFPIQLIIYLDPNIEKLFVLDFNEEHNH